MTDATGRRGRLRLRFGREGARTTITEQFAQAPFHMQRAMYCEEGLPEMAYAYLMSSSGGILGGDSHRTDIYMGQNSSAHITTQGATRIYGTSGAGSSQTAHVELGPDSYLEFVPDQIIPYANSAYSQKTTITAHDTSTLVYTETLSSGRLAMDESFMYDSCMLEISAADQNGRPRFRDAALLEPKKRPLDTYGVMGEHTVVGSAYVLAPARRVPALYGDVKAFVSNADGTGGASIMHNDSGVLARLLGRSAAGMAETMWGIAGIVRRRTLGAPFTKPRK